MIWFFAAAAMLAALFFLALYICWRMVFAVRPKHCTPAKELPTGPQYDEVQVPMAVAVAAASALPYEPVTVRSFDGLQLYGRLYEGPPGAPIQIMFHGYRSTALRDFSGGLQLALKSGCGVLLVDQRAHGKSQGKTLSFGVLERQDCLSWTDFLLDRFGSDQRVVLVGLSMGAATVMMAAELPLPKNVIGIMADCGYDSPKNIICKVMDDLRYPHWPLYPLVRLSGRLAGFDIESCSALESLQKAKVPVLLIHGEDDRFVPCRMSRSCHAACASESTLVTVPGAGHGLSYMVAPETYRGAVQSFLRRIGAIS